MNKGTFLGVEYMYLLQKFVEFSKINKAELENQPKLNPMV